MKHQIVYESTNIKIMNHLYFGSTNVHLHLSVIVLAFKSVLLFRNYSSPQVMNFERSEWIIVNILICCLLRNKHALECYGELINI